MSEELKAITPTAAEVITQSIIDLVSRTRVDATAITESFTEFVAQAIAQERQRCARIVD